MDLQCFISCFLYIGHFPINLPHRCLLPSLWVLGNLFRSYLGICICISHLLPSLSPLAIVWVTSFPLPPTPLRSVLNSTLLRYTWTLNSCFRHWPLHCRCRVEYISYSQTWRWCVSENVYEWENHRKSKETCIAVRKCFCVSLKQNLGIQLKFEKKHNFCFSPFHLKKRNFIVIAINELVIVRLSCWGH